MALIALTGFSGASAQDILAGKVISVADGDTLTILDARRAQHRIRLAEIDAPESGQAFGNRSKQLLASLCFGEQAEVRDTSADRYGRVVGTVYCRGTDANAEMVRQGLAWVYVQYARRGSPLFELERTARSEQRGLWSDPHPVEPWLWRRGDRAASSGQNMAARQTTSTATVAAHVVRGNRNSRIYHLAHCPSFEAVSPANRVGFASESAAQAAGFRRAGNCPG